MLIPVCFATDDAYAPYCGVAINSLIMHGSTANEYKIYILYERLSKLNIARLQGLSIEHFSVECIGVRKWMKGKNIVENAHLSIATVYRLLACDLFNYNERLLYLDSDIVIEDDVSKLFNVDISGKLFGAVHGSLGIKNAPRLKKYLENVLNIKIDNFFNAGVLLFNVKEFRQEGIGQRALELLDSRDDLVYMDQCALNILCEGKVAYFDKYWNFEFVDMDDDYAMEEIPSCGIYHFDGTIKPWQDVEVVGAEKFWHYARQSVFYEEIMRRLHIRTVAETTRLFHMLAPYRRIAIYGAGYWGRKYVHWIRAAGLHKIVIWVDKTYNEKINLEIEVHPVVDLMTVDFEAVLISLADAQVCEDICKYLVQQGIDKNKCIWLGDRRD